MQKIKDSYKTLNGGHLLLSEETREHLVAHAEVDDRFVQEIASKIILPQDSSFFHEEVNMGRVMGRAGRVKTESIGLDDPAWFVLRKGRVKPSRIVFDAEAPLVSTVVVMADPTDDPNAYRLITAYIGKMSEREPHNKFINNPAEFIQAAKFWCREALVFERKVADEIFRSTWRDVVAEFGNQAFVGSPA